MSKLSEMRLQGEHPVCEKCNTAFYRGRKEAGRECPYCGGRLILKELSMGDIGHYTADDRQL